MNNDLISRRELKNELFDFIEPNGIIYATDLMKVIDNAPTVEERKQGEWIAVYFSHEELNVPQKASMFDFVKCPFCETIHQGRHHFCSWCGADLRGGRQ